MGTSDATFVQAPEFHPTVWGDFFINFTPEPLQVRSYIISLLLQNTLEELFCVYLSLIQFLLGIYT
jgi:hypothetical protein